ncbi:NADP-dependent oxidoreductase [Bacillus gaemokensis]|uniref:Alcohol dehydrogenase n=1 Tax=Bacillus gaemokensis TaxID=574375 RepID=A0A073KA10_9BACI|nr:NADP-dependent oxidoreductase [Bacillus gaemokensis]KEK23361.1 alcohol dehydrogenase [Bacillus gaemokensis]KYG37854.1 NADP-dependent oxidoreductase [Bacillus gaemokensis]
MTIQNQQIVLAKRPEGVPTEDTFEFRNISIDELKEGQVLVKTLYLSVDPYMRGRMNAGKSYVAPYEVNHPISGGIIGEVIKSRSEKLKAGDKVQGSLPWQLYNTVDALSIRKIENTNVPLSAYLSVLGMTGLTAYFGLLDIGQPKRGETVVVSGAAGAVGSIVGQIAKIKGARVVGIAGSDEKIAHLENDLGFDKGINYKATDDLQKVLAEACPDGVDVYFDNVGGKVSDAVISLLNDFARIPLCGAISAYNTAENEDIGPRIQPQLLKTRSLIKGFIVGEYSERFDEGRRDIAEWLSQGKIKYEETITQGFENVPNAFFNLFTGKNVGKQLVKVSSPSR